MKQYRIKQSFAIAFAILAIAALSGCAPAPKPQANGKVETFRLSAADSGQYDPAEIRVKRGSTVRIEGDTNTLKGGMDTLIIEGYDLTKKMAPGDSAVEFVADKAGTFTMRCANYMGNGKLIVE